MGAVNLRFKKKITKITKIWKEQSKKNKSKKRISNGTKAPNDDNYVDDDEKKEIEHLRMENRKIRRQLSSKSADYNRLQQEFTIYKTQKEDEIKKINNKYKNKSEEYDKLLRSYKQIN